MQFFYYYFTFFILICTILNCTIASPYSHHQCSDKFDKLIKGRNLNRCQKLPTLGAELGWRLEDHGIRVVFGAPFDEEKGWLAWGVNPGPTAEMVGTKAAIGIKDPEKGLYCHAYDVTMETRIGCRLHPSTMEEIECLNFEYDPITQYHLISAKVNTSSNFERNPKLNIVWQMGYEVEGDEPKKHVATLRNVDSVETLNFDTAKSSDMAHIQIYLRKVHGILNIVGWGTLLPIGVIVARFMREFPFRWDKNWFRFHVACQTTGYLLGVIGWGIGMWLGNYSLRYNFFTHRLFAILIFVCATLQTLALWFRPNPHDDFRRVWNIYHHFLGYTLLILVYINIFEGIKLMKPDNSDNWKFAITGILVALGLITFVLECYTWKKFFDDKSKRNKKEDDFDAPKIDGEVTTTPTMIDDRYLLRGVTSGSFKNGGRDPRGEASGSFKNDEEDPYGVASGSVKNGGGDPRGVTSGSDRIGGGDPHGITYDLAKTGGGDPRRITTGPAMMGGGDPRVVQS